MRTSTLKKSSKLLLFILFLGIYGAFAQQMTVTGKVTSTDEGPLPGVNVILQGTSQGTVTDMSGNYSLEVPGPEAILVFSSIGYVAEKVTVGNQSTINMVLTPDVTALQEIVVTGYSVDTKRETTGSVSTVKPKDLTVVPSGNVEQQLQGRVAGVTVVTNGQPGTTSQVRVRGFGAFGGNEPLYIVDGVPVDNTEFLNPDDIETTTVLKDAAAASIYGSRAANGVIVYTTRQGKKGTRNMKVTYDGLVGFTDPGHGQKMMNPTDFATWTWKMFDNTAMQNKTDPGYDHKQFGSGSQPVIPDYINVGGTPGVMGPIDLAAEKLKYNVDFDAGDIYQVVAANKEGTDWYGAITRVAPMTRHTIGLSGGGENSRYYFGLGAQDQDGILIHQKFKRYTFRANSEFSILNDKVRIGENLQGTYRQVRLLLGGSGGSGSSQDENVILSASRMPTIIPVYDEFGGYAGTAAQGFNNPANPVAALDGQQNDRGFGASGFGNVFVEVEPVKDLVWRTSLGGDFTSYYSWGYTRHSYENAENNSAFGYAEGGGFNFGWVLTNTLDYKKNFGNHALDVMLGQEALNTGAGRNMGASGLNPFSEDPNFITMSTLPSSTRVVNSSYYKGTNYASYFGQLKYSYNDKYLLSFVLRHDGSSSFGSENKYGNFPAVSVGWRISDEPFMSSLTFIDELKIRGGYGIMGNSRNVDPNNQYSLYATSVDASSYDITGSNSSAVEGFYRSRIGNPFAKWEKAITENIGFDGTFFEGRLDVILDVWQKNTEDLLFQVPQTVENGIYAAVPSQNVGKMVNKGVDLEIMTEGNVNKLGYQVTLNGGFLHNEIVSLIPGLDYLNTVNPSYRGINPIRNEVGHSLSAFYGYKVLGLFQSQAEIDAAPTQAGVIKTEDADSENPAQGVGRFRYADISGPDGVPDGLIDTNDRTYLGSPVPKFTGGLTIKLNYSNFELEIYSYMSLGNKIWNQSKWFSYFYPSFAGASINERVKDSWTPENPGGDVPIFENVSNFSTNAAANSWYVEDGSYFRMQSITLAYNIPQINLDRMKIQKLRIFASANNIFTITKYEGLDPSVGGAVDTTFGIDIGNYPITRSFTFGVNLAF